VTEIRQVGPDDDDDDGVRALAGLRAAWAAEDAGLECGKSTGGRLEWGLDAAFEREFRAWFRSERRGFFLAVCDEGEAMGTCNVVLFTRMPRPGSAPSCWAYLANVYVMPSHRGHGVGESLVRAAADHAHACGAVRLVTAPSGPSRSLYARHGFRAADELLVLPRP